MEGQVLLVLAACLSVFLCVPAQHDTEKREPPKITRPVTAEQRYFRANDPYVALNCSATGTPPPRYEWYYNGQPIEHHLGDITVNHTTGSLVIRQPGSNIAGPFTCRARTTFSTGLSAVSISPPIDVREARIDSWPSSEPGQVVTSREGQYVSLACDDKRPQSVGPTSFKWYKTVNNVQVEVRGDDRIFIDHTGTLHFTYVRTEDTNPGYACALSNTLAGSILTGRKNSLTVTLATPVPESKPVLQFSSKTSGHLTFEVNNRARLECVFSGHVNSVNDAGGEVPVIEWYDNANQQITSGQQRYTIEGEGRALTISTLREADEKLYTCKASSTLGTAREAMLLNVTSPPIWVQPLEAQVVPEGRNAVFHCEARSAARENPPQPPTWFRNGVSMSQGYDPQKHEFSADNTVLTVRNPRKASDIACYQCYVTNSVGQSYSQACLNVILPITIITRPQSQQAVGKGNVVNLTVVATSDPLYPVSYKWHLNNVTYESPDAPPHVIYDVNTQLAYINTSGLTDGEMREIRGLYRREVYHKFERFFVDVEVVLKNDPGMLRAAGVTFDFWIVGLVLGLLLLLLIAIVFFLVVVRRKMMEGHYPVDKKEVKAGLDPEKELQDSGFDQLSRASLDLPDKSQVISSLDLNDLHAMADGGDDESFGSAEYGEEVTAFNEDGSFIGVYNTPPKTPPGHNMVHANSETVV